jgi:hypothetical protein
MTIGKRRFLLAGLLVLSGLGTFLAPSPASAVQASRAASAMSQDANDQPLPLLELKTSTGMYFYTLDRQEADAAIADYGMKLAPTRTGYLRPDAFAGSQPVYRLGLIGQGKWLLTASASERDGLVATGSWHYDGIVGYAASTQQPNTQALYRYHSASDWRVGFRSPGSGWTLDGPLGYVPRTWVRAGALYFGTFDADTNPAIIQAGYDFFHRGYADWWAGVRDYSGRDPSVPQYKGAWPNADFSDLEPSIGFYDDSQTSTLEKQISQASGAGLDYFAFYWYWDSVTSAEQYDTGLHTFLQAGNRNEMEFSLQVCSPNYDQTLEIPAEQFDAATTQFVSYLSQPNYLRANDGRPIVWLCDTRGIGSGSDADVTSFVTMLRDKTQAALGTDALVVANQDLQLDPSSINADGDYCGAPYNATLDHLYQDYLNGQRAYYAQGSATYIRCVMARYDERPRYPTLIPDLNSIRYASDWNFDLYNQAVSNAYADIQQSTRTSAVDNFLLVYAWNEWHEGGHIEPNVRDGCRYLDILQQDLGLPGSGCIATG